MVQDEHEYVGQNGHAADESDRSEVEADARHRQRRRRYHVVERL